MKDKILTGVLFTSLMITSGGYAIEHTEVNKLNNMMDEHKKALKENSAKIANLESVIENKDIDLKTKESAIDNYIVEINGLKESSEELRKHSEELKRQNEELKNSNEELKNSIEAMNSVNTSVNTNSNTKPNTINTSSNAINSEKVNSKVLKTLTVNASAYTSKCKGCSGITASGYSVKDTIYYNGMRIIATDNSVIPMHSIVRIEGFNEDFIVLDRGGAIKGNKIDILFANKKEAYDFGRKNLKLEVIRYGK